MANRRDGHVKLPQARLGATSGWYVIRCSTGMAINIHRLGLFLKQINTNP